MSESCALLGLSMRSFSPALARLLGKGPATFLQTLHWRLEHSTHRLGGRPWVYDTYDAWQEDWFPHVSTRTLKRHVQALRDKGLVITRNDLNAAAYDTTLWYTIDYDALNRLDSRERLTPQRSDKTAGAANPGPRPKGQSGTSPPRPKGQNVPDETLRFQNQEKTPGEDISHVPDVVAGEGVGCLPQAAALVQGAAQPEAPVSAQERESPAPCTTPVSHAVQPEAAGAVAKHEAPAELRAAPQRGEAGLSWANGACQRAAPPEFGFQYLPAWSDARREVGHRLDERGARFLSAGFLESLTTRYPQEFAYAT
jgi:hypothetical protein